MSKNALYEQDESSCGSEVKLNVMEFIGVKLHLKVSSNINLRSLDIYQQYILQRQRALF
jgi:hypothetical protein